MKAWALALLREATQRRVLQPESLIDFQILRAIVDVPVVVRVGSIRATAVLSSGRALSDRIKPATR